MEECSDGRLARGAKGLVDGKHKHEGERRKSSGAAGRSGWERKNEPQTRAEGVTYPDHPADTGHVRYLYRTRPIFAGRSHLLQIFMS